MLLNFVARSSKVCLRFSLTIRKSRWSALLSVFILLPVLGRFSSLPLSLTRFKNVFIVLRLTPVSFDILLPEQPFLRKSAMIFLTYGVKSSTASHFLADDNQQTNRNIDIWFKRLLYLLNKFGNLSHQYMSESFHVQHTCDTCVKWRIPGAQVEFA